MKKTHGLFSHMKKGMPDAIFFFENVRWKFTGCYLVVLGAAGGVLVVICVAHEHTNPPIAFFPSCSDQAVKSNSIFHP